MKIIVTDIIVKPVFDLGKPKITCGVYSEEENDLLDQILAERVDYAGRGTRGGAIAAATTAFCMMVVCGLAGLSCSPTG